MTTEAQNLMTELTNIHKHTKTILKRLGNEGVNWQPPVPETNSAAVIVTHMCGSEMQWVGEYVGGVPAKRVRETEFKQSVNTVKGLVDLLDKTEEASRAAVSKHSSASLDKPAVTGRPDFKGTVRDCVLHALTHESQHMGHLELTEQLWRAQK